MYYFEKDDLDEIFGLISRFYAFAEEVPKYHNEHQGVELLLGVLTGAKMDEFYPTLLDKAAYLLVQINKGHFFSNGNKRLALVFSVGFLAINDKKLKQLQKEKYREILKGLFPNFSLFEDQIDFSPEEFALYNLSLVIADSHKYVGEDFNLLKKKVKDFFEYATMSYH